MDTRKKTTAGVLVWTPAPVCTLPTRSVLYEDENGEQAEKDDFVSQMNENGIIGLSEDLKNVELGETCSGKDSDCNLGCHPTLLTSEKLYPNGYKWDTPPEEMRYSFKDHLTDTELPGEKGRNLLPYNMMSSVEAQRENEAKKRGKSQRIEHLSVGGSPNANIKMKHRDKKENSSDVTRTENDHSCTSGVINGLIKSYINKVDNKKIRSPPSCGHYTPAGVSCQPCQGPQSARLTSALTLPYLLHFTPEEFAAAPGIDAETFPEMDFIESLTDSESSLRSSLCSLRKSKSNQQKGHQAPAICPELHMSQNCSSKSRQSPNRDSEKHNFDTNTKAAEMNKSKKWTLSHRTPDLSKVESRIRFPKNGAKLPKSKLSSKKEFPGSPVVHKSPAEMMKDVFLEASDQPPSASDCDKTPASALPFAVPQDVRSWQQATILLEQLQEDYNRLLTKYAEAENTIDRLRLEAKVNLYSDLPKPGPSLHSGQRHDASKFMMMLDFPQTQKADIKSAFPSNGHSSSQTEQVDNILYIQADSFLQQLQAYQDILSGKKLKPHEQMRDLSKLVKALDSLERGYLLAKDDHKLLHQEGTKVNHFDPERKLEGLIYQCGLYMDELKEQVEKMPKGQPTCETHPSPPTDPNLSHVSSEMGKTLPHPQTLSVPLMVDYGAVEVSSVTEESDQMEVEDDEIFKSFYLKPMTGKHRYVPKDSVSVIDGNIKSNHQDHPPLHTSKQQTSRSIPSLHGLTTLPVHVPSSSRRFGMSKSHSTSLNSLGEITTPETRISPQHTGSSKLLSQNGIISPEADSGFVGSERSHLTPLAAWSLLHQSASEGEAFLNDERTKKPSTVTRTSLASSPSHSHMEPSESSHLTPDQQMRNRQGQRHHIFSCSPQHWLIQTEQPRMSCRTAHSASEDGQSEHFNKYITLVHRTNSSSMQYDRGNSVRAPGFSQVVNRDDAIESLQAELTTLKERLESCLENKKPYCSVRASPSDPCSTFAPHMHGDERQNNINRGRGQTNTDNEVEELRRGSRSSASAHRQKAQSDICKLTISELKSSVVSPQPQMAKCTQTSAVEMDNYPHTNAVYNRMPRRGKPDVSIRDRACQSEADGKTEAVCSSHCRHYPLCRRPNLYRSAKQADSGCCRGPGFATYRSCQLPPEFTVKAECGTFNAAPPILLQYMPMCPPPILLYSSPINASPNNSGASSAVRGCGEPLTEVKERNRCSLSADKQLSLDRSLNKAIRAARHMKDTSRRMAHSLATGLEYQELLTQSCSY
ncbi:microtubule organization protein AKNA isoform X3 [Betta splendens]|uniref:Microtubule organization protein AKNA isoform X3 n=1 Tax=Betta splendens TaxID=158456 RepID=A0A8M1HKJ4_BETSP|nr:microtubule organization protein AKNA isoform X3 [Betta splendens]